MKFRSVPHVWAVVAGFIILAGPAYLIYGFFSRLYTQNQIVSEREFFAVGIMTTLAIWSFLLMIFFVKIIIISDDRIRIIYPFRVKRFDYQVSEIEKHKLYSNHGRYKDYETLHFKTKDNRVYMIMQYEYWNYQEIRNFIKCHAQAGELSRYGNLGVTLILLVIAIGLTVGWIFIFNNLII